jgi:hypothetical protein
VIVGIAVDNAASKMREARKRFTLEEIEEIGGEGAAFWILDVAEKPASPEGASEVPLEVTFCEGVRKAEQSEVEFAKETAKTLEKLERMGIRMGEDRPGKKGEKPDEASSAVGNLNLRKEFAFRIGTNARERQVGSAAGEMNEGAALHVDERVFTRGVHDLQDKFARVGRDEAEIVVVFAGERMGNRVETVQGVRQSRSFLREDGRGDTRFGHEHGEIVSREWVGRQIGEGPSQICR